MVALFLHRCVCRLSSVCRLWVTLCIVAKRWVLEQKLLWRAYTQPKHWHWAYVGPMFPRPWTFIQRWANISQNALHNSPYFHLLQTVLYYLTTTRPILLDLCYYAQGTALNVALRPSVCLFVPSRASNFLETGKPVYHHLIRSTHMW